MRKWPLFFLCFLVWVKGPCLVNAGGSVSQPKREHTQHKALSSHLYLFIDPYCQICHHALRVYQQYSMEHPNIHLSVHYFPLHKASYHATQAILAARAMGKEDEMRDKIYRRFKHKLKQCPKGKFCTVSASEIESIARSLGLDRQVFHAHMKRGTQVMKKDLHIVHKHKIDATPSFILHKKGKKPKVEIGYVKPEELFPTHP